MEQGRALLTAPLRWALVFGALLLGLGAPARAWNDHALLTWLALQPLAPAAAPLRERVRAETLESFLAAEAPRLEALLAGHETWARAHLDPYDARPDALAFRAPGAGEALSAAALRQRFLQALRVNPRARLPLYLQLRPGEPAGTRVELPWTEVTTLGGGGNGARGQSFVVLASGEEVEALEVLASASQEPDFGLDIGLYADSGTPHGQHYGFGRQPFGNPALDYGSQAPLHMGFHHESAIVFAAAGFLRRTQPEARIALFTALARHALQSGHRYWGWRFAGWALHYAQDLTQPYHARVLPGISTLRMIAINTVAMLGWTGPTAAATTLVSNRHSVVESFQQQHLTAAWRRRSNDDPVLAALADSAGDSERGPHDPADVKRRISAEASGAAAALDEQIARSFPRRFVADPAIELGSETDDLDMVAIAGSHSAAERERLVLLLADRLRRLGVHTRALVRTFTAGPQR